MGTPRVVVVGSYNQDCVWRVERAPQAGETVRGHDFASAHGGKGFNQAVACVRQGVATTFIAAVGEDAAGEAARHCAAREGIDACWQQSTAATGNACILVESAGQNRIVVALGANENLAAAFVQAQAAAFAQAQVLLTQLENNLDATRAALATATAHGLLRILNPAPVHAGLDAALLAQVDLLTPNESEFALLLQRLTGTTIDADALARLDDARLHELARRLGVGSLILTLGAQGCFVSHGATSRLRDEATYYRIPAEAVEVVDTTGAGDAFSGALASSLARWPQRPLRDGVVHANRCAALSTQARGGAAAMPTFDALTARFGAT